MDRIDTVYQTPTRRIAVHYDSDTPNPLEDWDHGVSFHGFDESTGQRKRWDRMSSSNADAAYLDFRTIGEYREFYGDSIHWYQRPMQNAPSLRTFLDAHAVWTPLYDSDRDGLHIASDNPEDWEALAYIPYDTIRAEYSVKRITKRIRAIVDARIRGVISEYRSWADGECYWLALEVHNPACPYCDDPASPADACKCWDVEDSIGGIIGADYISDAISDYFPLPDGPEDFGACKACGDAYTEWDDTGCYYGCERDSLCASCAALEE